MKNFRYIEALKRAIEQRVGKTLSSPGDFDDLLLMIESRHIGKSSRSSVKRLWGYVQNEHEFRDDTLSVFARFVGYRDWKDFCATRDEREGVESGFLTTRRINVQELECGERIEIGWMPDRRCVVEYLGDETFRVIEAENAKLTIGSTFRTDIFGIGMPMYATCVDIGDGRLNTYVAGREHGLTLLNRITRQPKP